VEPLPAKSAPAAPARGRAPDRLPPQNVEAERAILGAILLEREALGLAIEKLEPEDFYRREHQILFAALIELYRNDQAIDAVMVAEALGQRGQLEQVGGRDYLSFLLGTVATAANVGYHAGIVREKAVLRGLIHEATAIVGEAYDAAGEAADILERAQSRIFTIAESTRKGGFESVRNVVPAAFRTIEEAFRNKSDVTGLRTGFAEFDKYTAGLQKSDLIVLAARPAMGKTALALNLAYNIAVKEQVPVAIFSLEMAKEQLVMRMLCSSGGFNNHDIRRGQIAANDWPRLTAACERLASAPIFIDDSSALSPLEVKAKARLLKQQHSIGFIVIDYLQLMTASGRAENRQQEITEISRNLKGLAKDLGVPVMALSQLSRAVETRGDNRPKLSDLRESGAIEQDADVVLFIYREELVHPDDESVKNLATIIIGKQRNGPTGQFDLHFNRSFTRFDNLQRG
jgi:replicative DNA helicase